MDRRLIFIHGLGGDEGTWGKIPTFIAEDEWLGVTCHFFVYPTFFAGLRMSMFQKKYQGVQDLAKSLRTYIQEMHKDADELILVGHSLGGLVIKQYLLDLNIARQESKVKQVVLFAVPNNGAELARLCRSLSVWKNPHLLELMVKSDFIKYLNNSWRQANLEEKLEFKVVVAGNDKIVDVESAEGLFLAKNISQVTGVGHTDICKPKLKTALAYTILRNVISKKKVLPNLTQDGVGNFQDWQQYGRERVFEFKIDSKRESLFNAITSELTSKKTSIRIKGLSGLGKTRLVYEAILASNEDIRSKVSYCNVANSIPNLTRLLKYAVDHEYEGILVVDNCKPDLHIELTREVLKENSQLVLITIDHNLDNLSSSGNKEFIVEPMESAQIKAMLEPEFGNQISDLDRIAEFAQGFPKMAVLISEARIAKEVDVGILNDDDLVKKLLGQIDSSQLAILKACSLFDRFGSEAEVSEQYKFIADSVVFMSHEQVYACLKTFEKRGLIDLSGRFSQVVPKPLAVRLASEWWRETSEENQLRILAAIPDPMIKQFCKQVTMLGFLPEVQQLTVKLCGTQGPFGQAEVILSNRGSLLFRSFVEVNPEATASALYKTLTGLSPEELLQINGDVRRNLVWALEMLAFHGNIFAEAAWCLLLLASAENETWSNNSTGIFKQLFDVNISGTEAPYPIRLQLLEHAIALNSSKIDSVVIKALGQIIETHGGSRTVGAEYQGNRAPLKEYRPKIWQEIFDYWERSFELLIKLVAKQDENSVYAEEQIGYSIRGMINNGRIEMLEQAITKVVAIKGQYWPSALDGLKSSLEYDSDRMKPEAFDALNRWIMLLTPSNGSIDDKIRILVVNPPWEHRKGEDGHYQDVAAINSENLARELSRDIVLSSEQIEMLITGEQKQSFAFGKAWAENSTNCLDLIEKVILKIIVIENPNLGFLIGLIQGLYTRSPSEWAVYMQRFGTEDQLIKFYPFLLRTGVLDNSHLDLLLNGIKSSKLSPYTATYLGNGGVAGHLTSTAIIDFSFKLADINADASWAALDVLFMYCFGTNRFEENKEVLKRIVLKVPLNEKARSKHSHIYHWKEIVEKFTSIDDFDFAREVCLQIIKAADEKLSFEDLHHSIKPVLTNLIILFKDKLWPILGEAILRQRSLYSSLTSLFDKEDRFTTQVTSPLIYFNIETLIEWAKIDLEFGPFFLGRVISIFEKTAEGRKQPTELFIRLLEEFGHLERFGGELSANLATRGWSGSLVPYLEDDRTALSSLLSNNNKNVKTWTKKYIEMLDKQIEYESIRDNERDAGIY